MSHSGSETPKTTKGEYDSLAPEHHAGSQPEPLSPTESEEPANGSLDPTGKGSPRWAMRWKPALIAFEGRITRGSN
ncbi:hypothetical protein EH165_10700 [Nakamurella antarctica]|uniref:Uncharacterized protein n=1 Tax=Nakamurella antarctica TaxID=1902245 RepID=A0A3G8ZN07_9ACTN|nr:hypothetical protein EH165_10700 [Nakamurella antarctica]